MSRLFILRNWRNTYWGGYAFSGLWALLFCFSINTSAQNIANPINKGAPISIRATHVLGFENTKDNCNGTLLIQGDLLQFQQDGKPTTQIRVSSIRNIFVNEEDKQVGGVPMTLGKAAAPFGGGRVVSLVAHKDYDILTVEYVDSDGGLHGSIFRLNKGEGEVARNQLLAVGISPASGQAQQKKQSSIEDTNENK